MANDLDGRTIAILATDGVEQVELEQPRDAVQDAGARTELLSLDSGDIQAMNSDLEPADTFSVDKQVSDASVDDYDALILPGGTCNPDRLRMDEEAVSFVRDFVSSGKPVAAICHGPWTLVEADVLRGRRITSFPSLRTDLRNAGADVLDEEVVVDANLISSRDPDDLPAFCDAVVRELSGVHASSSSSSKVAGAAPQDPVAKGLGVFSFALGIPQTLSPGRMNRLIGVKDDARSRVLMRAVGVRELAAGVGIFSERRPAAWIWARVAGDTMDLALLGSALRNKKGSQTRTLAATGAVVGAFAADVIDGVRLSRSAGGGADRELATEPEQPVQVKAAITVRRDRDELYSLWRDFERFPDFMIHLEEVRSTGPTSSHWKARGPLGKTVEWDAQITADVPGERIAWRSVEGSEIDNSGSVRFVVAPANQGTEVHVDIRYSPPAGAIGATLAKLFGEEPGIQLKDDLRRFKQVVETGEVVRSDGSPEGQLGRRQLKQRPAQALADDEHAAASNGGGRS